MVDTSKHVAVFKVISCVCVWSALCSLYCLIELQYVEESVTKKIATYIHQVSALPVIMEYCVALDVC